MDLCIFLKYGWDRKLLAVFPLFCPFIPMRNREEKEKMTKGGDIGGEKKWWALCVFFLWNKTHSHALMHSFICTFTSFHDSSFMHGRARREWGGAQRGCVSAPRRGRKRRRFRRPICAPAVSLASRDRTSYDQALPSDLWQAGNRLISNRGMGDCFPGVFA